MIRKIFLFTLTALVIYAIYWFAFKTKEARPEQPKMASMKLKKHSEKFNGSIDSLVTVYMAIKNALTEADTGAAKKETANFIEHLNNLPLEEMKTDTALVFETVQANVSDIRSNAESLMGQTDIKEMRKDFSAFTDVMYPSFFTSINYEGPTLYLTNCPMAFDDNVPANWISDSREIVNPYLGKNDAKYKGGMLHCGEIKDSVMAK